MNQKDDSLLELGLGDINIDWSQISDACKSELTRLLADYQDIFSKQPLDLHIFLKSKNMCTVYG